MEKNKKQNSIIIADTTPLISLIKINRLDIIHKLFNDIQIPYAVYDELTNNPQFQDEARKVKEADYIKKTNVIDKKLINKLMEKYGLDKGESEAIALSKEANANLLLVDEMKGRNIASQMNIEIMGTLGILLIAYDEKIINGDDIFEYLEILHSARRYIDERLYKYVINHIKNTK